MAHSRSHGLGAPVGPINGDVECGHGQGGFVLASDPDVSLVGQCSRRAVYRVPGTGPTLGQLAVCPYHLARYLDDHPAVEAKLREQHGPLDASLPDHPLLGLDHVPHTLDALEDHRWRRLGLDTSRGREGVPCGHAERREAIHQQRATG